ncbi:MAG: glucosamine-6-phosphate deaminase [Planctomycetales bacterium]|nr:glucosamine-6-phosphate deaminase [Planctomycetales bacterium]
MNVEIFESKQELGRKAAEDGAAVIRAALDERGCANIILATGASQFDTMAALVAAPEVDWSRVTCFHLDEYVGLPITHGASFRKYLRERFVEQLPCAPAAFHYIDGEGNCELECDRLGAITVERPIDAAFIGIGENGHLAFNDPPADFATERPYLVVELDDACRRQQQGEGWFPTLNDVPTRAISMSVRQIMKSAVILCSVPDQRKAHAVRGAVQGPVTPEVPASILQQHPRATLYLDRPAASQLDG